MRFCPHCSADNSDDAPECRRCGRRFLPMPPRTTGAMTVVGGAAAPAPAASSGPITGGGPITGSGPIASSGPVTGGPITGSAPATGGGPIAVGQALGPVSGPESIAAIDPPVVRAPRRTAPLPSPSTGPIRSMDTDELLAMEAAYGSQADRPGGPMSPDDDPDATPLATALGEPGLAPPPTRQIPAGNGGMLASLPVVAPLPEAPERGLLPAARYALGFARGLWRRRVAIGQLNEQIRVDTIALDGVLGALGRGVRQLRLNNRSLAAENQAIDEAEQRRSQAEVDSGELVRRLEDENQRFTEQELDRENKLAETEVALREADKELDALEAQRRSLRDKRKVVERQQRAYLKTAEEREVDAAKAPLEVDRTTFEQAAEDLRREAADRDPERQDLERRLTALEKPVSQAAARVEALRGEQESIRRALHDLREGHRQRLSEIEAEQGRKGRDVSTAEAEIGRRMITLGTLLNLNRIERPEFDELYARVDHLRNAIGARGQEIDRLVAERGAYDRGALVRGVVVLVLALVVLATAVVLALALV